MQDTHHLLSSTLSQFPFYPSPPHPISLTLPPRRPTAAVTAATKSHIFRRRHVAPPLPAPPEAPPSPSRHPAEASPSLAARPDAARRLPPDFYAKLLYLDSLGLDFLALIESHPPILHAPLPAITAAAEFLLSPAAAGLSATDLRRAAFTCPEILTLPVASRLAPALAFLLREARVPHALLPRVLARRPRLLATPVASCLRPTLLFLHSIGIHSPQLYTNLLTSSVEDKLLPRIHFFQNLGFSHRDAVALFRRFPPLFCYSIRGNLEPKLDYLVVEMGRDLREIKDFPQYFSFSLENRIKPRHQSCVERGVCFPLAVLLRTSNAKFSARLELCCEASMPVEKSPLWCTNCDVDFWFQKCHK